MDFQRLPKILPVGGLYLLGGTMTDVAKNPPTQMNAIATSEITDNLQLWQAAQRTLAASTNLALVTVGADNDIKSNVENETSICRQFLNDPQKSRMCAEYCGRARQRVLLEGQAIKYRCAANLHCFAAPVKVAGETAARVVIGGRTFLSINEYREFLQREAASSGRTEPSLFSNIKFTDSEELERSNQMILSTAHEILQRPVVPVVAATVTPITEAATVTATAPNIELNEKLDVFYAGSLEQGCREAMRLIGSRFNIRSAALLIRNGRNMLACSAGGEKREELITFALKSDSVLLSRLQHQELAASFSPLKGAEFTEIQAQVICHRADAFPLFIGEELAGLLLTLDTDLNDTEKQEMIRLGQSLIVPLELARLRNELSDQSKSLAQWQDFSHLLSSKNNAPETYSAILEKVVSALGAERVSLLVYNDEAKKLVCKAASGLPQEISAGQRLGEGISGVVLERGEPLLVRDLREQAWVAARAHGNAHSNSFISFPIVSGGKRLGVINLTDRGANETFNATDLEWLRVFAPYAAAALEKIDLHEKAQRFQLMAITDPLTGLLNRRYLEERFTQEIERSKRYQFPLSFIMMDIDGFKAFNDTFGHQAGDEVLRETAHCIRKSLRNFDVAARYGGEEFIVVLPETDVTSAMILAERLRKAVEQHFASERSRHPVTISVGVSSLSKTLQNRQQVIRAADQALYAAKKRGKNCVVVYNTELVPGLT